MIEIAPIYAISLWQPWASLITADLKPYETRSWPPPRVLIGKRIAIHAAKHRPNRDEIEWAERLGVVDLPFGAMVCTAILQGAWQCGSLDPPPAPFAPDEFGDYSPGRWAWHFTRIEPISPAIPARGSQGFWRWSRHG